MLGPSAVFEEVEVLMPWSYGIHWAMWLFPALFLALMLFMFLVCARGMSRKGMGCCAGMPMPGEHGRGTGESARDILDRRYARGEISRDEYQRMRQDVEGRS